ncbi:polysaccharide biosynthesis protein [Brevibacillus fulvus]|uniref:FlaA1/EpsC-like NDP-sugar epimerase n=1 Tax=Brevibacillus fulvus TaxID=1125967 RepID=A0A938XVK8_9BACL|nr:nucleoside-diphosphate sugar epimerase/dehydratase [Brevibacillus fulvus]MBM7588909.1 FlaA1/EpsC-like NDP-sugar epimerase [Brevibacillus fulvus]
MNRKHRLFISILLDAMLLALAVIFSYLIRFEAEVSEPFLAGIPYALLMVVGCSLAVFIRLKIYNCSWQYASTRELLLLTKAAALAMVTSWVLSFGSGALGLHPPIPSSIFILAGLLSLTAMGASRMAWYVYRHDTVKYQPHHKRTLVIGAGSAGRLVVKELLESPDTTLYPVAFLDDDPRKQKLTVMGVPIVGTRAVLQQTVQAYKIELIIIAIPSLEKRGVAELIGLCKRTGVQVKMLPRVSDMIEGKVTIEHIRDVQVEDLLGRDSVEINLQEISAYLQDKVVLVTGAGGSIGSELCRQISAFHPGSLLLLGHGENSIYAIEQELRRSFPHLELHPIIADIQDRNRIESVFQMYRPGIVFHAAAHKHVPLMEQNAVEAIKNNIFGTKNLAECADTYQVERFVSISTDKAVNPTSVMGATKRITELMIQSLDKQSMTKFVAVRFGNVLGSRGSVIPLFKQQIREGGPVTVTHPEMVRYFMTISEAVQLVIQAGAFAEGGEIFILDMGKPVKIADLAHDLIRLSGLEPGTDIQVVYTGIRPGEKLFEEILTQEEGATASKHQRIYVGKPTDFSYEDFSYVLRRLEQMTHSSYTPSLNEELLSLLHHIVPSYQGVGTR